MNHPNFSVLKLNTNLLLLLFKESQHLCKINAPQKRRGGVYKPSPIKPKKDSKRILIVILKVSITIMSGALPSLPL